MTDVARNRLTRKVSYSGRQKLSAHFAGSCSLELDNIDHRSAGHSLFWHHFVFWAHLACCPADGAPLAHWQETHGSPDMEATEILMNISASIVRVDDVAHGVLTLLSEIERPAIVVDRATGQEASVSHEEIARADGYLPVIVVAAEALWFDLTGTGFALDVRENAEATLGYSLHGIRAGSWSVLMLCIIDLFETLALNEETLRLNDLVELWGNARSRLQTVPVPLQEAS
ncbi:hypothetical protein AZ09_13670 [Acetobacter aceti 1023]|nr:hypothetical protein AZ09_13670 [Acetobacter aceti 1023]